MAPVQDYATHRHVPRPTVFAGVFVLIALGCLIVGSFGYPRVNQLGLISLTFAVFTLVAMSRTYITALQDRIIKLEMRVRCEKLLTPVQVATLWRLSKPQIIALRFASDEELPALLERAEREGLSADQIKRAVKNWRADWDRT